MKTKNAKKPATTLKVERPIGVFDTITANGFRVESGGYLILVKDERGRHVRSRHVGSRIQAVTTPPPTE